MAAFSVPVDNTSTSAVSLVALATGQAVRVRGFILTPAADVEVRFRDSDHAVLLTLLFGKGAVNQFPSDAILRTPVGKGLEIITVSSVRITGLIYGTQE